MSKSNLVIDEKGRMLSSDKFELADRIMKLRATKGPWAVIDELVKYWVNNAPDEVEALKINLSDIREVATDKRFGVTKEGANVERRLQLIFPTGLQNLIRGVYKNDEIVFDKEFYNKFSQKYPGFRVSEKG